MSGPVWYLRPARLEDAPALRELELELFPEDSWSEPMLRAEIAHETRSYWIAQDTSDGQGIAEVTMSSPPILGYAGVMVVGRTADVQNIAVVARMRGRGLGSTLLQHLHETAAARGADEVLLEVRESNRGAQSLYRRFGYDPIAQRPRYYPDGETAIVMRAELTPEAPVPSSSTTDLTGHMTGPTVTGASQDRAAGPRTTPSPQEDPR